MTDKGKNRLILRRMAANAFWRSRRQDREWSKGYWHGLFQGYQFAADLIDLSE
jgi:hypothetical protein